MDWQKRIQEVGRGKIDVERLQAFAGKEFIDFCFQWNKETVEKVRRELRAEHEEEDKKIAAKMFAKGYSMEQVASFVEGKIAMLEQVRASLNS